MRGLMLIFLYAISYPLLAQLPSFDSNHLQSIWVDEQLKGTPSEFSIQEFNYNRDSARLYKSEFTKHYYYTEQQLRKVEFRKDGKPIKTYSFDELGRILEQLRTGDFESIPRITYSYNEEDLFSEELVYRVNGTLHSKTIIRFNDSNQVLAREEYKGNNDLSRYWLYSYDQNDLLNSEEYYDLSSEVSSTNSTSPKEPTNLSRFEYSYDSNGQVKRKHAFKDEILLLSNTYSNFPDSTVKETVFYQADGWPTEKHVEIKHDSAKVLVKGFYNSNDTTRFRSRFKEVYVDGDLLEYESRTLRGTFVDRYATFYEYDYKGNWIKKTTYSNGITLKVVERKIRY